MYVDGEVREIMVRVIEGIVGLNMSRKDWEWMVISFCLRMILFWSFI